MPPHTGSHHTRWLCVTEPTERQKAALRKRVENSVETTWDLVYTFAGLVYSVAAVPCNDTFGINQGVVGM